MELATLPAANTAAVAWIDDAESGDLVPITVGDAVIDYYGSKDNDHARNLSCLRVENGGDEPQRFWLPLSSLQELEGLGVPAEAEREVTEGALERYIAAQALYAEVGQPELHL